MGVENRHVDVVVVGAGTAGANVAGQFAARGRSVVLVERRAADDAGAQWHNGVLPWQFERAGVEPPVPAELASGRPTIHFVGPDGRLIFTMSDPPLVRADMASLGRRLREVARDAGAEILDAASGLETEVDGDGRLRSITVDRNGDGSSEPDTIHLGAELFVDASGRSGVLRRRSPVLARWCPPVRGSELCSASDHQHRITDRDGARRFLERHGARAGENVTALGPSGGWSTAMVTVSDDLEQVTVLTGCLADGRNGTGIRMAAAIRAENAWIGEVIHGGAGVIPLRRPYARFTAPGLALVGDAACQVFSAHGSGIGLGLMAGRFLVEATAGAVDIGAEATLWRYQHRFQREFGGTLAAFDAFRRMSTALGTAGVGRMTASGLLSEDLIRAGLDQRWILPPPSQLPATAVGLAREPAVAAVMLPRLARAAALRKLGDRAPEAVDEQALHRWDRRLERLLGPLPAA